MTTFMSGVLSNLVLAAVLAAGVWLVTRWWRSPQAAHALWLLVLIKLVTPPLVPLPIPSLATTPTAAEAIEDSTSISHEIAPGVACSERPTAAPNLRAATEQPYLTEILSSEPIGLPLEALAAGESNDIEIFRLGDGTSALSADESLELAIESGGDAVPRTGHSLGVLEKFRPAILGYVWLVASGFCLIVLTYRCRVFRRWLRGATDADDELTCVVARLAARLEVKRLPRVQLVDAQLPPLVWSLGLRPRVILPARLLTELSAAERETVIAHELAHIKRRDHLVRWLEVLVLVPFWWYPVVWLARRKLHEAEEEACDAWVVWALPAERRSYGEAMLRTIEFLTDSLREPVVAGSALGRSFYQRRIHMILKQNVNRRMSWTACLGVGLLAAAVLPLAAQTEPPAGNPLDAAPLAAPAQPSAAAQASPLAPASPAPPAASNPFAAPPTPAPVAAPSPASTPTAPTAPTPPTSPAVNAGVSNEELLSRIERLERLIERLAAPGARDEFIPQSKQSNTPKPAAAPDGPADKIDPSPQLELAHLDVVAARTALESAQNELRRAHEVNVKVPGTYSAAEFARLQTDVEFKEIELKRAEVKLRMLDDQLKELSAYKANRAEVAREHVTSMRQLAKMRQAQSDQALHQEEARLREAAEMFALQQSQLAEQHARLRDELARIGQLAQERPKEAETRRAVEEFLKTYLKMSDEEAKAASERLK